MRTASQRPSTFRVLRQRNFWPYFVGIFVSNSGTWFQNIALSLFVFDLTGSVLAVALLNFAQFAPVVIVAPWAGAAADRFDRRRLLRGLQVAGACTSGVLAVLVWAGFTSLWLLFVFAFLIGLTAAFTVPSMHALLPQLVEEEDLPTAIALNSITFNLARAVGPVAGAAVIATFGIPAALAVNVASYLVYAAGLQAVRPRSVARPGGPSRERVRMRSTLRMVRADPALLALLLVLTASSLAADPVSTLSAGFVIDVLGRPGSDVGLLIGAFGAGAVTAGVTVAGRFARPTRVLPVSTGLLGLGIWGYVLSPGLVPAMVSLFVGGCGYLLTSTSATAALYGLVTDEHRGRVMALWTVAYLGVRPVASVIDGVLATAFGVRVAGVCMGATAVVAAVGLFRGQAGRAAIAERADRSAEDRREPEPSLPSDHLVP